MKREIKFRGLRVNGKGWIYGMPTYYFKYIFNSKHLDSPDNYEVISGTVGQFTGLKDKNGVDIYEGDILQDTIIGMKSEVIFTDYANFGLKSKHVKDLEYEVIDPAWSETSCEIIGNIHENKI